MSFSPFPIFRVFRSVIYFAYNNVNKKGRLRCVFLPYETEFVLFLAVLENSVLPMGSDGSFETL